MKTTSIQFAYDEEKLDALKVFLDEKGRKAYTFFVIQYI